MKAILARPSYMPKLWPLPASCVLYLEGQQDAYSSTIKDLSGNKQATITFRAVGQSPGANSTSCVIVKPVGLKVGDLMIAQVAGRSFAGPIGVFTSPAGWTSIRQDDYSDRFGSALFWKNANAADVAGANFTFTAALADSNGGAITAWYGHDPTSPINANNGDKATEAGNTVTSPEITPTVANCVILLFCGIVDNTELSNYAIATDNPASWDERYDMPLNLLYDLGLAMASGARPEISATGNGTATIDGTDTWTGQLVAIAPGTISGNHGTVVGASWKRNSQGLWYLDFDGDDDYVDCGDGVSLDIVSALTLEAWIYLENINTHQAVITRDDGNLTRNYEMYIENSNNIRFEITTGDVTKNSATPDGGMVADTWYHCVGTYNKVSLIAYLNAVPDATPTAETGAIDNDDVSCIIGNRSGLGLDFDGHIALSRIYNAALSARVIKSHYNRERHLFGV